MPQVRPGRILFSTLSFCAHATGDGLVEVLMRGIVGWIPLDDARGGENMGPGSGGVSEAVGEE